MKYIRNPQKFLDGFWDWGILDGCFGNSRIRPSDVDGSTERKGQTLIIETKSLGADLTPGQAWMYREWVKTGHFTVITVWGPPNDPREMEIWTYWGDKSRQQTDLEGFREQVAKWYSWADNRRRGRARKYEGCPRQGRVVRRLHFTTGRRLPTGDSGFPAGR